MLEKITLEKSKVLDLILPSDGFNQEFLNSICDICKQHVNLEEAYVALKKTEHGEVNLFFGFLFNVNQQIEDGFVSVQHISESILHLFKDNLVVDAVCLNGNEQLRKSLSSFTPPFYKK